MHSYKDEITDKDIKEAYAHLEGWVFDAANWISDEHAAFFKRVEAFDELVVKLGINQRVDLDAVLNGAARWGAAVLLAELTKNFCIGALLCTDGEGDLSTADGISIEITTKGDIGLDNSTLLNFHRLDRLLDAEFPSKEEKQACVAALRKTAERIEASNA